MGEVFHVPKETDALGFDVILNDGFQVPENLRKRHRLLFQLEVATFYAAHIEDIIDERQEMIAGHRDFG